MALTTTPSQDMALPYETYIYNLLTLSAMNTLYTTSYTMFLILVPPQVSHFTFSDEVVNSGEMVSAQCVVSKGDLPIKIDWFFNKKPIRNFLGIAVGAMNKRISTISIESADAVHAGEYMCVAENVAGRDSYSTFLNVNGRFIF